MPAILLLAALVIIVASANASEQPFAHSIGFVAIVIIVVFFLPTIVWARLTRHRRR